MRLMRTGALVGAAVLVVGACNATPGTGGDKGTINIAIELPLEGSELAASQPIVNGIRLAIKDAGGSVGGYTVVNTDELVFDDAVDGVHNEQQGATNMGTIVQNADTVAVIGPLNSSVAKAQIPVSNEGGLLQCSPANTNPDLTKGEPAAQLRTKPNNYIRVVTTDDVQGPAAAQYIFNVLGKKSVYIIDDTETFGKGIADTFQAEFEKLGGTVTGRDGVPRTTTDYTSIMTAAAAGNPESIYFGGVTASGGARILKAAVQAGLGDVPYMAGDGINDGSGETPDSFLNLAGADAANSYSTLAGIGDFPGKADFDTKYKAEYNIDATGYAATGYVCAQVILNAIERAAATNPADRTALREAVRVAGTATDATYSTVVGDITFDANGDTSQKIISIYAYDAATNNWVFKEQVDYADAG